MPNLCVRQKILILKIRYVFLFVKIILPSLILNKNPLFVQTLNSQVDELCGKYLTWMKSTGEFNRYVTLVDSTNFKSIEVNIAGHLIKHYCRAQAKQIECGGIVFEWSGMKGYHVDAYGQPFRYQIPLEKVKVRK